MAKHLVKEWSEQISALKLGSDLSALAWFSLEGQLLEASQTMCAFLGTSKEELEPKYSLINPNLEKIKQLKTNDLLVFSGLLTIGNHSDISFVLDAKIYRKDDIIFIYAEADVEELFANNKKMSTLNQEVNNLQRQLLKEKVQLEHALKALKETQQMLVQSEKMNALGQMVAGVAHEINNPMAFVINNLFELKRYNIELFEAFKEIEELPDICKSEASIEGIKNIKAKYDLEYLRKDMSDAIKDSVDGAERVKNIVEDLRRFSRLDEAETKNIDLIENLRSMLSFVQSEIKEKQIDFSFLAPEKLMLNCYPGQLNQALMNILLNAIQAVDTKGIIQMKVEENKENALIEVKDNGCGIEEENIEKIFNPFYTTKPIGSGTGLGLSITYKIISELHKGEIKVDSTAGKGSSFKISLPK